MGNGIIGEGMDWIGVSGWWPQVLNFGGREHFVEMAGIKPYLGQEAVLSRGGLISTMQNRGEFERGSFALYSYQNW